MNSGLRMDLELRILRKDLFITQFLSAGHKAMSHKFSHPLLQLGWLFPTPPTKGMTSQGILALRVVLQAAYT